MSFYTCLTGASADKSYSINTCFNAFSTHLVNSVSVRGDYACETTVSRTERAWTTVCQLMNSLVNQTCPADVAFKMHVIEKETFAEYAALCTAGAMFCYLIAKGIFK